MSECVLVTGAAGFIGFHLSKYLMGQGIRIIGVDNLTDYYDVSLKEARLNELHTSSDSNLFTFIRADISDDESLLKIFREFDIDQVIHLAAQAGVRYSIDHPQSYIQSNLVGFSNILEACRHCGVNKLIYASSSSVYGANEKIPFHESDHVDNPVSLYAATKKSNELMAHAYSHLYGIEAVGLRFFTVYGPWGRPDMAYFKFTKSILNGDPIDVYNYGNLERDFTYIDDIVEAIFRLSKRFNMDSNPKYQLYNIGNHQPVKLGDFIETIESALGLEAKKNFMPMQPGDVPRTYADVEKLDQAIGFKASTKLDVGIRHFVDWFCSYYD